MDPTTAPSTTDPAPSGLGVAWHPLSDRLRWFKIVLIAMLLGVAGAYLGWVVDRDTVYIDEMLEDPEAHHGADVYLGKFRVTSIEGDTAELWSPWVQVPAAPVPAGLAVGDPVSVTGLFQRDGSLRVDRWQVHELYWVKQLIGIVTTLGVVALGGWARARRRRRA